MHERMFQHPLAYLIGLEGIALLRGWAGEFDESFTRDRLADVQRLVADPALAGHPGVDVLLGSSIDGYRAWSDSYDEPNGLFEFDEPFVYGIVDHLPVGIALDAACGTGRFARGLVRRGHQVVGVDSSPEMLSIAARHAPGADLRVGELERLPVDDASVDLVVCALALSHIPVLAPVMAEFARVVRPGGHVIISDVHHELILRGSLVPSPRPDGQPALVPTFGHTPGEFLRAALPTGLQVRACEEPGATTNDDGGPSPDESPDPVTPGELGEWHEWPWSLHAQLPAAARAAAWRIPFTINWHFQREA